MTPKFSLCEFVNNLVHVQASSNKLKYLNRWILKGCGIDTHMGSFFSALKYYY